MPRLSALIVILLLLTFASAGAAEKPRELDGVIHADQPYGKGQLRRFFMTIYDADLWTDAVPWSWQKIFALTLHYHMPFEGRDLSSVSLEKMNDLSLLTDRQLVVYAEQLKVFDDVQKGDEITALYLPDQGIRFFHNGHLTGQIRDRAVAKLFLSIWLDEKTAEPVLRQQLLALSLDQNGGEP